MYRVATIATRNRPRRRGRDRNRRVWRRQHHYDRDPGNGAGAHDDADHDHQADHDHEHDVDDQLDDDLLDHVDQGGQRRQWQRGYRQRLSGLRGARKPVLRLGLGSRNAP
jgi:hypothetical protein